MRFETTRGLQAQLDLKEEITLKTKNGEMLKMNIFLMVLGYQDINIYALHRIELKIRYLDV